MGAIASVLLFTGGLNTLQTASLIAALPFTVIILLLVVSFTDERTRNEEINKKLCICQFRRTHSFLYCYIFKRLNICATISFEID